MSTPEPADVLERTVLLFAALAHPARLRTVMLLSSGGPLSAGELADAVGAEQSSMSHQLRVLKEARLVRAERRGRHVLYALCDEHVACLVADAVTHAAE